MTVNMAYIVKVFCFVVSFLGMAYASDSSCSTGILSDNVCCPKYCTACGGANCNYLPGGSSNCCKTNIKTANLSCDWNNPPCIVTSTAPPPANCNTLWSQCGGTDFSGSTCCVSGSKCNYVNAWYSQCIVGSSNPAPAPAPTKAAAPAPTKATTPAPTKAVVAPAPSPPTSLGSTRRKTAVSIILLPNTYQREQQYGMHMDGIFTYQMIGNLHFEWLTEYLTNFGTVQMVMEFTDSSWTNLQSIANGSYDWQVAAFAQAAAKDGRTLYVRPLHEFNGDWYSWAAFRGNNGDPGVEDRFKAAFRRVVQVFRDNGAWNVKFQWAPNNWSTRGDISQIGTFYPGDAYVDMCCFSAYNFGGSRWQTFSQAFGPTYKAITSFTQKPICLGEGSAKSWDWGGDKAAWMTGAWQSLATEFPRVTHINWFFENKWDGNWDLNTDAEIAAWKNGYWSFKDQTKV